MPNLRHYTHHHILYISIFCFLAKDHAYHTYDQFLTENEAELKTLPVPAIARKVKRKDGLMCIDFNVLYCVSLP